MNGPSAPSLTEQERRLARALHSPVTYPLRLETDTIVEAVADALPYMAGRLLDLGCGAQPYAGLVASRIDSYVGVDLRPRPDVPPTVCADSLALPFKACSFNTVLCTQVLEHVRDPFQLMAEIQRVLAPGGHGVFTLPAAWPLHEEPYDFFRYTRFGLEELSRRAGLEPVLLKERGGAVMAITQLFAAVVYDVFGRRRLSRIAAKGFLTPLVGLARIADRIWFYPKFSLGYLLVARKH